MLANQIVQENRPVEIQFVTQEAAQDLGLRKPARTDKDELRLIDIQNFDLSACGGTHVANTGQIGSILLRKIEKARQGWRVEFVCGQRAVKTARRDYATLVEAAALYSGHIWDVPQQVKKFGDDLRSATKATERLLEELAEFEAARLLAETMPVNARKVVVRLYPDRDLAFIRLLAQKITRLEAHAVALLAASHGQPALVFAQSKGCRPRHGNASERDCRNPRRQGRAAPAIWRREVSPVRIRWRVRSKRPPPKSSRTLRL